ncbi:MAG: response regulator [Candidatus Eisenbacteria bacterium]|uniref:Response regulator n=1 Tax=Eiseniibacteriota bacterium TaxID=2212470 RepID=A0A948RY76_UNCEI|nr:response regulator [Candidatus Eisenbacteria bacterium]MBU1950375.1 response regulator [Candidatus Eisenbacteria bacterium]MBU2691757.1 response regulator [Candidatus Eisenbacteria bacterium]
MARLLVVDDDERIRIMLRMTLEEAGYDVEEAPNGVVALQIQEENPVDLVITDIIMPEKEGIETIMDLHRRWSKLPIIAISGGGRDTPQRYLGIAKGIGAARIFPKPILRDELLEAITELLAA